MFYFPFLFMINFKLLFSGFQCNKYQSAVMSAEALTLQNRTHCKEDFLRLYKCNICSYSTDIKTNIKQHSFVHSGERPYKCEVCSRGFTQLHVLKSHMLIHTGEKPHTCNICKRSFRHASSLSVHMHTHLKL